MSTTQSQEPSCDLIQAPCQLPQPLTSLILAGPDGALYELSPEEAARYRISAERLRELGHPPLLLRGRAEEEDGEADVVSGHHKVAAPGSGASTQWSFHPHWEYGVYVDIVTGNLLVGFHRHPYRDERGVGAEPQDFA